VLSATKRSARWFVRCWRWLTLASVVAAIAGFVLYTDTPRARYHEYHHHCRMIFGVDPDRRDVDLAVIGSSRSMRVFQADALARKVRARYGESPVIFDLSRSYRDMGHMLPFVEDLLREAEVDMLLVEYKEAGSRWRHPNYERTATFAQIAESFQSRPSAPVLGRLHEQVRLVLDRLTYRATQFVEGDLGRDCVPAERRVATTMDPSEPWFVSSELLVSQREKHGETWRDQAPMVIDLEAEGEERNTFYVRRMIDLAGAHDVSIYFYYVPALYAPPMDDAFVARFEGFFGAPLLQLPLDDLERVYPTGFTDASHMGVGGADVYMTRLTELLPWPQYLGAYDAPAK